MLCGQQQLNQSFARIPAKYVLEMSERAISSIMAKRKQKDNEAIADKKTILAWRKKFPFAVLRKETDKEAIHRLKNERYGFFFPSMYAWKTLDDVEQLKALAETAISESGDNAKIFICREDADLLRGYTDSPAIGS